MPTSGPNSPGTLANDTTVGGSESWTTVSNAASSNNTYATNSLIGTMSNYIKATNFGFAISGTITGITVTVERSISGGTLQGAASDYSVRLVKAGTIVGSDYANAYTGAGWDTGTDDLVTYGGASDLWGTTWTASDINNSGFGLVFSCQETDGEDAETFRVDHVTITVTYGSGNTYNDTASGGALGNKTATIAARYKPSPTGGATGGKFATINARYRPTVTGGATAGSSARVSLRQSLTASGGAVVGGSSTLLLKINPPISGGATLGGLSLVAARYVLSVTGGATLGGVGNDDFSDTVTTSGGAVVGGAASYALIKPVVATGGAEVGGGSTKRFVCASCCSGAYVSDTFWDDEILLYLHAAETGQSWTTGAELFLLDSEVVYVGSTSDSAVIDTTHDDYTIQANINFADVPQDVSILFRYVNASNFWRVVVEGDTGAFRLIENFATLETVKDQKLVTVNETNTLTVTAKDGFVSAYLNDDFSTEISATATSFLTATKVGFMFTGEQDSSLDNFCCTNARQIVIATGGATCGGSSTVTTVYNVNGLSGAVLNGYNESNPLIFETGEGGAVCGGAATSTYSETATGGALASGVAGLSVSYNIRGTGGAVCGGSAQLAGFVLTEVASGGAVVGGSVVIKTSHDTSVGGSLMIYHTGAGSSGASQADPDDCLGGFRSNTEFRRVGLLEPKAISNVVALSASGSNPASGHLGITGETVAYAASGGSLGASQELSLGMPVVLSDGASANNWVRIVRTTTDPLRGFGQLEFVPVFNSLFNNTTVGGDTKYRSLILTNYSSETLSNLKIYLVPLGTVATCTGALSGSGSGTLSGSFADWPFSGVVGIATSGGVPREVVYYSGRTNTALTVVARGLMGTSATAGSSGDLLTPIPCCRVAKETVVADAVQSVANESTAPTGLTWSYGYSATTAVTVTSLAPNESVGLWFERSLPSTVVATPELEIQVAFEFTSNAVTYTDKLKSLLRVADASLVGYETHIGVGAEPDLSAAPDETFTSLPHDLAYSFDPDTTYHIVTNLRNKFNLVSQLTSSTIVALTDGEQVQPPPSAPQATIAATGTTFQIVAYYYFLSDPVEVRGDAFSIYISYDGSDPLLATPILATASDIGGVLEGLYESGTHVIPTTARAVVRTYRSDDEVESTNTNEITVTSAETAFGTPVLRGHYRYVAEQLGDA